MRHEPGCPGGHPRRTDRARGSAPHPQRAARNDDADRRFDPRGALPLERQVIQAQADAATKKIVVRRERHSGTIAVASISILAAFSTRPATCTTAMAG